MPELPQGRRFTRTNTGAISAWRITKWSSIVAGEYVKEQAHTNGIESFWALLKRGYIGTYHNMSVKHLNRYVNEFAGRHNQRPLDTAVQMECMARGLMGKRLRYQDLVAE